MLIDHALRPFGCRSAVRGDPVPESLKPLAVRRALMILTQGILASRAPTLLDGMSGDAAGNTPASLLVMLGSYGFASLGVMAEGLMMLEDGGGGKPPRLGTCHNLRTAERRDCERCACG